MQSLVQEQILHLEPGKLYIRHKSLFTVPLSFKGVIKLLIGLDKLLNIWIVFKMIH